MVVCPNCNHQNPDGAVQCEACYTPLPTMTTCPNCSAKVQADASFCGQCGFNLKAAAVASVDETSNAPAPTVAPDFTIPNLPVPDPLLLPDPLVADPLATNPLTPDPVRTAGSDPFGTFGGDESPDVNLPLPLPSPPPSASAVDPDLSPPIAAASPTAANPHATQLQIQAAKLLHVQTNAMMELPPSLTVIHIGKANDRIPPDIDVSGFPSSEIVSRIHADIRVESDSYYLEDVGSSNGTYVNNMPLPMGNRHRLRPGDRISLGKGDKVTFLFQLS